MGRSTEDYLDSLLMEAMASEEEVFDDPYKDVPFDPTKPITVEDIDTESYDAPAANAESLVDVMAAFVEPKSGYASEPIAQEPVTDYSANVDISADAFEGLFEVPEETYTAETIPEETYTADTVSEDTYEAETMPEGTYTAETAPEDTFEAETTPEDTDAAGQTDADAFEGFDFPDMDSVVSDAEMIKGEEGIESGEILMDEEISSLLDFDGMNLAETDLGAMLDDVTANAEQEESDSPSMDDDDLNSLLSSLGGDKDLDDIGSLLNMNDNSEMVDPDTQTASELFASDSEEDLYNIQSVLPDEDNPDGNETDAEGGKKKKKR